MFLQIAAIALTTVSPNANANAAVSVSNPLPEAPMVISAAQLQMKEKKHNFNRYDYALYAGVVAYRVGDYWTTEFSLARGSKEDILPKALVDSKPGFMAYSLGIAAVEIEGSIYLHKHGHAKMARIADSISIGAGMSTDLQNYARTKNK